MNQNIVIGILIALIVLVGGYFIVINMNTAGTVPGTATTTPSTDTTPAPDTTAPTGSVPSVVSDTNVAPTNSTAVVTGSVTPNGAQTTYWYEYGQSATFGYKTSPQTIGSGFTAIAAPGYITGLTTNTTYYFRLDAQNSYGAVNGSISTFSTNNNPPMQGNPPSASSNAATVLKSTSANLNGHITPHSSQTTYWFEYGSTPSFGQVTAFQSGGNGNTSVAVSASVSGLNPQTTYYFRINAQNQYGTVNGATQSFTTPGPAASVAPVVTTQVASSVTTTTATLRGTVNPYGTQTTYWFEYSTDAQYSSALHSTSQRSAGASKNTSSVSANITALQSKTTYYFRTVAQNSVGTVRGASETLTTK